MLDLELYLAAVFISREKQLKYFCQKLNFMINSYKEDLGRTKELQNSRTSLNRKREIYLIKKFSLILYQK